MESAIEEIGGAYHARAFRRIHEAAMASAGLWARMVSWDAMAEDTTRRLLKAFGMAVTDLEEAVEGAQGDAARRADAVLRERMKEIIELVETLSERAATL